MRLLKKISGIELASVEKPRSLFRNVQESQLQKLNRRLKQWSLIWQLLSPSPPDMKVR